MRRFPIWLENLILFMGSFVISLSLAFVSSCYAKTKNTRFYDFSDQLIDGQIKKPSTLWMNSRSRAKFNKLLRLKKSFRSVLIQTSQDPILK